MAINKIIKFGLEEEASKLKEQGMSDQKIADELSKSSNQKITQPSVYRYFSNSNKDPAIRNVKQREKIVEKAVNNRLDTAKQLDQINRVCIRILKEALEDGDRSNAIKAAKEVRDQLEFQSRIIGDITEGTTVNINYYENKLEVFQKIIFEEISDDEERARITERLMQTQS